MSRCCALTGIRGILYSTMSRKARNLHSYLVQALASSIASREGVIEAAVDFGTLQSPDPGSAGVTPDVVARSPDGSIIVGEAKYGTAWRAAATTRALRQLLDWRYEGQTPSMLVLAASAGRAQDAEDGGGLESLRRDGYM